MVTKRQVFSGGLAGPGPHWVWIPVDSKLRLFARKAGEVRGLEMAADGFPGLKYEETDDRWYCGALGEAAWRLIRTGSFRYGAVRCPSCFKYQPHIPRCIHCEKDITGMDWQRGAIGDEGVVELKTTRKRTLYVSTGTLQKKALIYVSLVVTEPPGEETGVFIAGWATNAEVASAKIVTRFNKAHALDVYKLHPYIDLSTLKHWKGKSIMAEDMK